MKYSLEKLGHFDACMTGFCDDFRDKILDLGYEPWIAYGVWSWIRSNPASSVVSLYREFGSEEVLDAIEAVLDDFLKRYPDKND
jgi:hypothetical protein